MFHIKYTDTKTQYDPKNKDNLKKEDDPNNEDYLKSEDAPKMKITPQRQTN